MKTLEASGVEHPKIGVLFAICQNKMSFDTRRIMTCRFQAYLGGLAVLSTIAREQLQNTFSRAARDHLGGSRPIFCSFMIIIFEPDKGTVIEKVL